MVTSGRTWAKSYSPNIIKGQMTVPRLVTLLRSIGIFISKRQVASPR